MRKRVTTGGSWCWISTGEKQPDALTDECYRRGIDDKQAVMHRVECRLGCLGKRLDTQLGRLTNQALQQRHALCDPVQFLCGNPIGA